MSILMQNTETNGIEGVIFDVDGTVHGDHSNELILRDHGKSAQLTEIDGMFYRREIDAEGYIKLVNPLFDGLTREQITNSFRHFKPFEGFEDLVKTLLEKELHLLLASCGPHIIVEQIKDRYGFHSSFGSDFEFDEQDRCIGKILRANDENTKQQFFVNYCKENRYDPKKFVGVGDSITDRGICLEVNRFIAINPRDAFIKELEHIQQDQPEKEIIVVRTTNLEDILPYILK